MKTVKYDEYADYLKREQTEGGMENLDQSYHELKAMTREEFEKKMLQDIETFQRYVWLFLYSSKGPGIKGILEWSWNQYQSENQPANKSWEQEAKK